MPKRDLAVSKDILEYLAGSPFASTEATPLSGGFGNYTFRLRLQDAYNGRNTLVLKHGKSFIARMTSIPFALYRQDFDQSAMRQVRSLLGDESLVTTPVVHLYDRDANVIIMDDCGENVVTLKDLYLQGTRVSAATVRKIGAGLGTFLARLHSWGQHSQEALDFFDGNAQARTLSAWVTYGRLSSTLSGAEKLSKLSDPPIVIAPKKIESIERIAQETAERIHTSREAVIMGDFWPGNVLVALTQKDGELMVERVFIVDWELVRPGLRGNDIGQFCAEMYQMRRFHPTTEPLVLELVSEFLGAYRSIAEGEGDLTQVARVALSHIGAHLVALTPRSSWGDVETTQEVVREGVQCLLDGYEGTRETIDSSFIGRLTADE